MNYLTFFEWNKLHDSLGWQSERKKKQKYETLLNNRIKIME